MFSLILCIFILHIYIYSYCLNIVVCCLYFLFFVFICSIDFLCLSLFPSDFAFFSVFSVYSYSCFSLLVTMDMRLELKKW